MRETLKRLAKLTAGYSLVTLIGPIFTILLTPLYTRALTPADYGVYEAAIALSSIVNIIILLGIDSALSALYFRGDEQYQRSLVTTAIVLIASFGVLAAFILMTNANALATFLYNDPYRVPIVYLIAVSALFQPIYSVSSAALKLRMGIRRVNALALTFLFATVLFNVLFVLVLQYKATGIIAANVLAGFTAAVTGLVLIWRPLRGPISPNLIRPLMIAGLGLLPGTLSYLLLSVIDRVMLTQYVSQTELGLYSIANKITSMTYVIIGAAWAAWWPMAMEMAESQEAAHRYARMLEYFVCTAMLLGLCIGLFAPEILLIFTRAAYVPAAPYALVLMIYSAPLGMLSASLSISLYVKKRFQWVSIAYIAAAAANIALNLFLCPVFGVWGAIIATVLAGGLLAALMFLFGRNALSIPARYSRLAIVGTLYLALTLSAVDMAFFSSVIVRILSIGALAACVFVVGIVKPSHVTEATLALWRFLISRRSTVTQD